jgi:hypothetical protein
MRTIFGIARDEGDGYDNMKYLVTSKGLAEVLCEMENEKDDFKRHSVQEMMIYESIQDYQSDPERKP